MLNFRRKNAPEDPIKYEKFANNLKELLKGENPTDILEKLFWEVDTLAYSELEYYYQRRKNHKKLSFIFRVLIFVFALGGIILPLIASYNANASCWKLLTSISLALAAGAAAANSWLDGTSGHLRYTKTQLQLEQIIKKYRISWASALSTENPKKEALSNLIQNYEKEVSELIANETQNWSDHIESMKDPGIGKQSGTTQSTKNRDRPSSTPDPT